MTSLHADEAFLGHYQFTHDPFAARVPGFKFFPAQRKPVLGQLHHLARYSQLLLVVSGPEGSGKTLLRQALVASTNKQAVHNLVVSARGAADPASLLAQIAQALSSAPADVSSILGQVAQLALTGQEVYLLVDDAELLSEAALEVLLLLTAGNAQGRPHVFLFGESSLLPRLELLADGEERFHAIELLPYTEEETREYLAQRLEGAGQGLGILSSEQVADIHLQSAGWPGAINLIARETLVEAMLAQRGSAKRGGFSLPKKHLLALLVVAMGVGAAWFMQGGDKTQPGVPVVAELPLQPAAPVAVEAGAPPAIEFDGSSQPAQAPLVGEAQPVIREPLAQASGLEEGEEGAAMPGGPSDPVAPANASEPVAVAPVEPVTQPVPAPPAVAAPTTPLPVVVAPEPVAKPPVVVAPKPAEKTPVVVAPKPVEKPPVIKAPEKTTAPAVASAGAAGEWYRGQTSGHFALQILGTSSESGAKAYVAQQGGEYHYFKKMHQGKPLYVVTYGSFATRPAAQAAIKALPAKVQASKPWPRTFASIQQDVARAR
ncbi:MAG: AAA family ATPase [Pseudomonas sp.]|uniref:SPOR domain-containing protein n=1 Tax=Pseudomonas sp. TaxID=306 RepID=UPI003392A673